MQDAVPVGVYKDAALLPSPSDREPVLHYERFVRMGVHKDTFERLRQFQLATAMAQYYGLVQEGLLYADEAHLFRGLERPLMLEGDEDADKEMLAYSWAPKWDWEWDWSTQRPVRRTPPGSRVFVIVARPFSAPDEHGLVGVVLHWAWIAEDRALNGAPINWDSRFTEHLWTKLRHTL